MENLPSKKSELLLALVQYRADPVYQWVLAEQRRIAESKLRASARPTDIAGMVLREQNFGRISQVAEMQSWMDATIQELEHELKQESQ